MMKMAFLVLVGFTLNGVADNRGLSDFQRSRLFANGTLLFCAPAARSEAVINDAISSVGRRVVLGAMTSTDSETCVVISLKD